MKITVFTRLVLLATGLLAAWQVAVGIRSTETLPLIAYTIAFGVLLVAALLLLILGYEVLDSPIVVIVSTILPLSLSLGLVWEYWINAKDIYLGFSLIGFLAIILTRLLPIGGRLPVLILTFVHGLAGLTIVILPIALTLTKQVLPGFSQVGIGGALIGLGGLLLSFLKVGHPLLPRKTVFQLLPLLMLLMTIAFVAGFHYS